MVNLEDFTPDFDTKDIIIFILCVILVCTCIGKKIGRDKQLGGDEQRVIEIVPNTERRAFV